VIIDVSANLAQRWLPTPYPMTSIEADGRTVRFVTSTGTTFVDPPLERGDSYSVTASLVRPTGDELRDASISTPLENGRYLRLPEDPDIVEIEALARAWTADARTTFDKALAIQERLQDPSQFAYDPYTELRGGTLSILDFLKRSKAGFCQQFAASMGVMLRSIGIQSRLVVGYATGTATRTTGQFSVLSDRIHSWVEVYFPGWGWMPFEPTPRRVNPTVVSYDPPADACPGPGCVDSGTATGGEAGTQTGGPGGSQLDRLERDPRLGGTPPRPPIGPDPPLRDDPPIGARTALLIAAIVGAVVLLVVPPARTLRRRMRLRRAAAEPRRLILVTFEQFTERAAGLGLGRGPGETLEEYRRKVVGTGYLSNGDLDRLTRLATSAAYSPHEPDGEQARDAGDAAETAIREIRRAVGPTRWLVGLYRRP
jgi:hypothetical protein